jgi:GTP:adenosylcobinamide-phosphate guanylyltransferase
MNSSIFIDVTAKLKDALKQLDGSTYGVLLVIGDRKRLAGTLTDGDARRAILSGRSLDESIAGAFNESPHCLLAHDLDSDLARKWFLEQHFHLIPLIDEKGCVTDVLTWDKFFGGDAVSTGKWPRANIDIPVVIMAGGKGSRLVPFTNILPKPLVPVADKTILELIIDGFREVGVNNFLLTLNYKAEMIRAYLDGIERDYTVEYFQEKQFNGTAGSLKLMSGRFSGDFIVSNCDVMVKADWAAVVKFHRDSRAALTVVSAIQHYQIPWRYRDARGGARDCHYRKA